MLSNKAKYALRALGYLAAKYPHGPVQIAEIAEQKKIPLKFLENILLELRKAEIVASKKGKGGGYFFDKDPKQVSVASVIRTIDGPISMLPCVSLYFYKKCDDCDEINCSLNKVFIDVRDATIKVLEKKSIRDLI
ncbi:MAG: Rrf2 family transcriptional regulator [Chitinophagaceae bacterium]|jgi:Rrf2 family protein